MADHPRFWHKPRPQRGPDIPYENGTASNPVLRGFILAPLAILIRSSVLLQSTLWKVNNFHKLKGIPNLDHYTPRYDPTVVPVQSDTESSYKILELPQPSTRKNATQYYTCADYHALYKSKKVTPLQVAEYLVSVVSRSNRNDAPDRYSVAFIDTKAELVLAAARASTERYEKGQYLSVMDGVPVAVKDEIELQGYRKTSGSAVDFTSPHNQTGWCVQKWEEAGAVVIGKTNMHESGMDTNGFNGTWGTPLNPHNETYYTGGSSSGSACTVAQGVCPITLGADGGGSIRLPSSFCGLYGLKPSHGRVSGRPTADLATSVGVYGPIASSIEDLALAYRIMAQPDVKAGTDTLFPNTLNKSTIASKPRSKLLGVDRAWIGRSDPDVRAMFDAALTYYTKTSGYQIIDITIPYLPENQKAHAMTILSEVRACLTTSQINQFSYQNQVLLSAAASQTSAQDFLAAQRLRNMMMQHLSWLWEQYPDMLILTPTTPCAGWKIGHPSDVAWRSNGASDSNMSLKSMEYVYVANWVGAPAITMPMGYSNENVPVGLMAMGEWGSEELLLSFAAEGDGLLGGNGIRRPRDEGCWVDVIANVKSR